MSQEQGSEILLNYSGQLKYDTIGQLIHILKEKAFAMGIKLVHYKKILLVMIESLENILKYNEHFEKDELIKAEYLPFFKIEYYSDKFVILSGNAILNSDVPDLQEKLSTITNLDNEGLKNMYKNIITNGQFTQKGGAGLGFIEIAKIATEKILFEFSPINEMYSYYKLKVTISDEMKPLI